MAGSRLRKRATLVIARWFDAPQELVFDALTSAQVLAVWLRSPASAALIETVSEPWPGGSFRHRWRAATGQEWSLSGTYLEVVRPRRLVRTELVNFGQARAGGECLVVAELTPRRGGTQLRWTSQLPRGVSAHQALSTRG